MSTQEWRLVLGKMCTACSGAGVIKSHYLVTGASGSTQGNIDVRCHLCTNGVVIKIATTKETLELLKHIPDLVEEALNISPACNCYCGNDYHNVSCPRY